MATSTVKLKERVDWLSPTWFAEEFAKVEEKDCRVVEIRMRSIPPNLDVNGDFLDRERGKVTLWGANIVLDRKMKAGDVVLRYEEQLEPVTPVKVRKKTLKPRR